MRGNMALIIVDMQNDFADPRGALYVPAGEKLVRKIRRLDKKYWMTIATLDYHPQDHYSFQENGGEWPKHCVQESWGVQLVPELTRANWMIQVYKGMDPKKGNDYSGFSGTNSSNISLEEILKRLKITEVDIVGLAIDYCVKATALDAAKLGFKTRVLMKYTAAVDTSPEAIEKVIEELETAGVEIVY